MAWINGFHFKYDQRFGAYLFVYMSYHHSYINAVLLVLQRGQHTFWPFCMRNALELYFLFKVTALCDAHIRSLNHISVIEKFQNLLGFVSGSSSATSDCSCTSAGGC